ncbi:chromosome transmission fidelity protein 18 homolog [Orussus abietinus]|uniref:chromosome transmission fidelity protein 18 homolog n=1 Tax=Orussus abietinus TaxID=222816 RepID=UPI000626282B|nr:chromosome transmission fidelity protein 18 homolog [Orussus abietinus]
MDDEFPDPDEEYDLLHEDDYDVLRELDGDRKETSSVSNTLKPIDSSLKTVQNQLSVPLELENSQKSTVYVPSSQNEISYNGAGGKKRSFNELCSETAHLLGQDVSVFENDAGHQEKRPRWDSEDSVIKVILAAKQMLHEASHKPYRTSLNDKKTNSISLRVPSWNFVAVTRRFDSQRLYIKVRDENNDIKISARPIVGLTLIPYSRLKAEAEEILTKINSRLEIPQIVPNNHIYADDQLWVEKYKPHKYMELLSDESVNRDFLHWLKLWDKIVFNRDPVEPHKVKQEPPTFGSKKFDRNKSIEGLDSDGFPIHRIALISGPPGLGKTTLAHIAAKHAGYNVVEMNASDDRGPEAFRTALLASTQMKAVMGADPRPNCLVLDEIDGAPAASIDILIKFVQGKLSARGKRRTGSERNVKGCRRPIVCICNELYTPSLRALRQFAYVIAVPEISVEQLAERLMEIVQKEGIEASEGALLQLAEKSGCDIRACLGVLQFSGSGKFTESSMTAIKDVKKGLFDAMKEILKIPYHSTGPLPIRERVNNVLKTVASSESDRLAQGIFHNYLAVSADKLFIVSGSLNWFRFIDEISSMVMSRQTWSLMPYLNYAFVYWHLNLAVAKTPKLSFPFVVIEVNQKLAKNKGTLESSQRASGFDILTLTLDIAPFLPVLLAPKLRSVAGQLFSNVEKDDLARLVNSMLDLGLSLVQERAVDGKYEYRLEPNLIEIGSFPECKVRRTLPYPVQQIVAQELEIQRLRRNEMENAVFEKKYRANIKTKQESEKLQEPRKSEPKPTEIQTSPDVPNHLKKLKPIVPDETSPGKERDFFGQIVQREDTLQNSEQKFAEPLLEGGFWFNYTEGFSNAVRHDVFMEDLL